jgi:hypothetical protein
MEFARRNEDVTNDPVVDRETLVYYIISQTVGCLYVSRCIL